MTECVPHPTQHERNQTQRNERQSLAELRAICAQQESGGCRIVGHDI
jgi:hypothetical protein